MLTQKNINKLLLAAIYQNSVEDVREALELGADVNSEMLWYLDESFVKIRPIQLAVQTYLFRNVFSNSVFDLQIMQLLIKYGADLNFIYSRGGKFLLEELISCYSNLCIIVTNNLIISVVEREERYLCLLKLFLENGACAFNHNRHLNLLEILCNSFDRKENILEVQPYLNNIISLLLVYGCPPPCRRRYFVCYKESKWRDVFENWNMFILFYCLDHKMGLFMF